MSLIEDVAPSASSVCENANKERFFFFSPHLFLFLQSRRMFLFLLALMHLLITEFLSKHLLWIRWIPHSFYHTLSLTHTHTQYIVLTVMSCEIGWEGWSAVL